MNLNKRDAAVRRHMATFVSSKSIEEVYQALEADDKKFSDSEIEEIVAAMKEATQTEAKNPNENQSEGSSDGGTSDTGTPPDHTTGEVAETKFPSLEEMREAVRIADAEEAARKKEENLLNASSAAKPKDRSGKLNDYFLFKVKPRFKKMRVAGEMQDVLLGYDRTGDMIKKSALEQRHADTMNAQTPNNMMFWFSDLETTFLDDEQFHN